MSEPASLWRSFWARSAALDKLGQDWIFQGQVTGEDFSFLGPYCSPKGKVRLRLYRDGELQGEMTWLDENGPIYSPVPPDVTDWPLIYSPRPSAQDPHKLVFTDEEAEVLWHDYLYRLTTLQDIWMTHVKMWKDQGLAPYQRYSTGVTMHGRAELFMEGYDETGRNVISMSYPPLSGPMPRVIYSD